MRAATVGLDCVFEVGRKLPGVEDGSYYGARALKVNGQMMACTPLNKSAEANSVVVAMSFERRAALLKKSPLLYYVTDHYAPHPTMLIRLSRISRAELERTLHQARDFASSKDAAPRSSGKPRRR